ncbi:MAG: tetratricopeptide repeat protein, partial [Deltaproteobacteria bacterium]|nr:tetratricopeptide repeat protein [Deltaproteobacteria bacterium]MBW2537974.1 tetratricopeptide repeat protein [Deltaproteobacteria bacterium]
TPVATPPSPPARREGAPPGDQGLQVPAPGEPGAPAKPAAQSRTLLQTKRKPPPTKSLIQLCEVELAAKPDAPRAARLHFEIGRAHETDSGDGELALKHYRQALEQLADHKPSIRAARRLLLERNDKEALTLFDAEIRLTEGPEDKAALWLAKAEAIERLGGDRGTVREAITKALTLQPNDAAILRAAERHELEAEDWSKLAITWERQADAVQNDPRYRAALVVRRARLADARLKRSDQAAELYGQALKLDSTATGALEGLKRLLFSQARWTELIEVLEVEAAQSDVIEVKAAALLRISKIQSEQLGDSDQAIEAALRASQVRDDDPLILDELARLYQATGDYEALAGTLEAIAQITERVPDRIDLYCRIGRICEASAPDRAAGWYEAALALKPSYAPATQALDKLYRESERWSSLVAMLLAEADDTDLTSRRADACARAADVLEQHLGDQEQAAGLHARALGLVPDLETSFRALCRLYAGMGRHHELIEIYGRAIDRAPDDEIAIAYLFKVGLIHEESLGNPAAAVAAYQRILELSPGHLGAVHALQRAAEAAGRWEVLVGAIDQEASSTKDPARVLDLQHRAAQVVDTRLDDTEGALARFRSLVARDAKYGPVLTSLGNLYRRLGRFDDLLGIMERQLLVAADTPERAAMLHRMGEIAARELGDEPRALKYFQRAIETDPACRPAVNALTERLRAQADWARLCEVIETELKAPTAEIQRASLAYRMGEILETHLDQQGAAVRAYRDALEAVPDYRPALDALARVLTGSRLYKELADELLLEADRTPDLRLSKEALLRAGHVLETHLANDERAAVTYETIREADPRELAPLLALEPLYRRSQAWDELADLYRAKAQMLTDERSRVATLEQLASLQERELCAPESDTRATLLAILEIDPNNRAALDGLERIALATEDDELLSEVDSRSATANTDPAAKAAHYVRLGLTLERAAPTAAVAAYRKVLENDRDDLAAIRGLARLAEATDDAALAVEAAHLAADWTRDPQTTADLLVRSAHIRQQRLGDREGAIVDAERALEVRPQHAEAAERLTDMLLEMGKPERVIDTLTRAAEATKDARRRLALWQRVSLLYADAKQDLPAAIATLERVRKWKPDHAPVLMQLGDLYERNGQYKRAQEVLERVIKLDLERDDMVTARMQLGRILSPRLGDSEGAIRHIEALLELEPNHRQAVERLVALRLEHGPLSAALEAAERLRAAAEADRDHRTVGFALLQIGRIANQQGDRQAAAKAWRTAVTLVGPEGDAAKEYRGLLGREEHPRRYADALAEHLRRVSAGDLHAEDLSGTFLELARTQFEDLGQVEDALATLRGGLDSYPRHPGLWLALGNSLAKAARHAEAIEELRRLVCSDPTRVEGWRNLARVLQEQARHAEAAIAIAPVLVVGEPSSVERNLEAKHRGRPGMAQPGALGPGTLQAISPADPEEEGPLVGLLGAIAEALGRMYPVSEHGVAVQRRERITGRADQPLAGVCERVARAFGFSSVDTYLYEDDSGGDLLAEPGRTPTLIIPSRVAGRREAEQVFVVAQPLAHLARGLWPATTLPTQELALLLAAAARTRDESFGTDQFSEAHLAMAHKRLLKEIPWLSRKGVSTAAERYLAGPIVDLATWMQHANQTAVRAAALLSGDLVACTEMLRQIEQLPADSGAELVRSSPMVSDLLRFWLSDAAMQVRRLTGQLA